ncbi:hypothetical protein JXA40_12250 [bacterium]|nr:hypothetical protein [candidate division CSSED10-310 bacterium]
MSFSRVAVKILGAGAVMMVCFYTQAVLAEDHLPDWSVGFWWDYSSTTDLHMEDETSGQYFDIVLTDTDIRYHLQEITTRTLVKGSGLTYDVYRLVFSGSIFGEGIAHITDPAPLDINIEIRNGVMNGEWWVDVDTLATVYFSRHVDGNLWAQLMFWQNIGTISLDMNEEYEPAKDEVHFPVEVGNAWDLDITFFTYGHYVVDAEIYGEPFHEEDDFDETQVFYFDMTVTGMETVNGLWTYRVDGDETASDGYLSNNYSAQARNSAREELHNLGSGSGTQLDSMIRNLTGYYVGPAPTVPPPPTSTPVPTSSAVPTSTSIPTYTSVPPTPTTPPGDPTFTPAQPTPTLPPTGTPTAPTAPTETPVPGDLGITITTNLPIYHRGELFRCTTTIINPGSEILVHQYVLLDVYGSYWFWPSWSTDVDFDVRLLDAGGYYPNEMIIEFTWPEVAGSASGLRFWAALIDPVTGILVGDYGVAEWGYEES